MATKQPQRKTGRIIVSISALLPAFVACANLLAPPGARAVAAFFPPWWTATRIVAAAATAGPVVRIGALPFIVIVATLDRTKIRKAGAWLLLDPRAMGGCSIST